MVYKGELFVSYLDAKDCGTGSCHLVQTRSDTVEGLNILVDCGSAYSNDPQLPFDQFPVPLEKLDYLFLPHAHIEHLGRVPDLIDAGFRGEIICTHAMKGLLIPILHETLGLKPRVTFKLSNAGHILGSCFILFNFPVQQSGGASDSKDYRVIFSGDHACTNTPILPDPDPPDSYDLLVMASIYGNRNHPDRKSWVASLVSSRRPEDACRLGTFHGPAAPKRFAWCPGRPEQERPLPRCWE